GAVGGPGTQGASRLAPAAARFAQGRETLRDRRALLPCRRLAQGTVEAPADRLGHRVLERRQAQAEDVPLVQRLDELSRIAWFELARRAQIRGRRQRGRAAHPRLR